MVWILVSEPGNRTGGDKLVTIFSSPVLKKTQWSFTESDSPIPLKRDYQLFVKQKLDNKLFIKYISKNMQKGDLQFTVDDTIFNYRVVVILETPQGYIFEKSGDGYFFAVGGKASINEISADSAKRELSEELGLNCNNLKIVGIIENFFLLPGDGRRYHELALVFRGHVDNNIDLEKMKSGNDHNQGFVAIRSEQLTSANIKPVVLPKIILDNKEFVHIVNKEV